MRIGVGGFSGRNPTGPSSVPYRRRQAEQQVGQSKISRRINLHQQNLNQKENMTPYFEYIEADEVLGGNQEHFDKTNFDFVLKTIIILIF